MIFIFVVGAIGLNILTGFTGQISIGHAAFMAVGAYTSAILTTPDTPDRFGGFDMPIAIGWLGAAIGFGFIFVAIKVFEFQEKFSAGISLHTNTFYMFYLSLTMFHFMHVILGMVILAAVMLKARRGGYTPQEHTGVETGASYWHMVDLVWIILFPLVYVIR